MDKKQLAKSLAYYSVSHLGRTGFDELYLENLLLHRFHEAEASEESIDRLAIDEMKVPDPLIKELQELEKDDPHFPVEIMGLLTPSPSEVIRTFWEKRNSSAPSSALMYLYQLQIQNYYIQKTAIEKNMHWVYPMEKNFLEITINLSKPEKNNKDIAKALQKPTHSAYPKCLLCKENLGFAGNDHHPARENIRIIPFSIHNEKWFLQFSPYCYYDQHVIVINEEHTPMQISKDTFHRLCDFVELFPEYFLGSNSDLPIVGGSILSHEHYQGGGHLMPIMYAPAKFEVPCKKEGLIVEYLDWMNSCVRLRATKKEILVEAMEVVKNQWYQYSDEEMGIIARTEQRHNAITPIVRKQGDEWIGYIILRNNRCDETYPDGIFHAHPEYHSIKKEGIGLIEAMGLFILPGRLKRQMEQLAHLLSEENRPNLEEYFHAHEDMRVHEHWIHRFWARYPHPISYQEASESIKEEINQTCFHILENTAMFPNTEKGLAHARKFLETLHFE